VPPWCIAVAPSLWPGEPCIIGAYKSGLKPDLPVLDQVCAILPTGQVMVLLADRSLVHQRLLHYLQQRGWHFRLRLPGKTLVHLGAQHISAIRDLCPPAGQERFFHGVSILGAAVGPVHLALATLADQPDDPWFVVSDEQTSARTLQEYGLRFDIEPSFRDEKSGGYQLHTSQLATPEALERLILVVAIATLHLTSIGTGVVQGDKRRWVDTHWDRGVSYAATWGGEGLDSSISAGGKPLPRFGSILHQIHPQPSPHVKPWLGRRMMLISQWLGKLGVF
jgi:hypothetical protein